MGERYRIPGLIDVLRVRRPGEILATADAAVLDRAFSTSGPLINRIIQRRIAWAMGSGSAALPAALPRDHRERAAAQRELARRLDPAGRPWDDASLRALADAIRGRAVRPLGQLVQEAIGRLFVADYRATRATWSAARALDAGVRSNNPLHRLWLRASGAVPRARATLAAPVNGDPAAVHATGIAVHTTLRAVERLGEALEDRELTARLSTRAVLGQALTAPDAVVRVATAAGDTAAGRVAAGTLVMLETASAVEQSADRRVAFLSESWSFCPAASLVPVLLAEIWQRATGERIDPDPASGEQP